MGRAARSSPFLHWTFLLGAIQQNSKRLRNWISEWPHTGLHGAKATAAYGSSSRAVAFSQVMTKTCCRGCTENTSESHENVERGAARGCTDSTCTGVRMCCMWCAHASVPCGAVRGLRIAWHLSSDTCYARAHPVMLLPGLHAPDRRALPASGAARSQKQWPLACPCYIPPGVASDSIHHTDVLASANDNTYVLPWRQAHTHILTKHGARRHLHAATCAAGAWIEVEWKNA